ncbi:hypothetical protein [uncultured Thiodictyon sp.]|uniref:hypothetical protein n=1 Tax=uncultured Thiodictyon sp. TaxID=1846217 RepID=UPI0025D3BF42|nr:hypothetical protein [uncultured Thiodictyon sp.]
MLNTAGLRLDQAPPITVPFAFFLAAPPFAVAAGLWLTWAGDAALASRWTPQTLALTHLIALGFLTQILCGALLQLLPVLAGAPVPRVIAVGRTAQALLTTGTVLLCAGLAQGSGVPLTGGALGVAAGLALLGATVALALTRSRGVADTRLAMALGLSALAITVALGLVLVAALQGCVHLTGFPDWVDLHLSWSLLGWAGLLIMGVGYQVVPMFHVTPPYPAWLRAAAVPLAAGGLVAGSVLTLTGQGAQANWALGLAGVCFAAFAVTTLDRQRRRDRPILDTTLLHWRSAMVCALAAAVLWLVGGRAETIGVLLLVGVGVGLPSGMLFKIMPFLSWFHLQHRQLAARRFDLRIPHMHGFVPEARARLQFWLHLGALGLLVAATIAPGHGLTRPAGVALAAATGYLGVLLGQCYLRYRAIARRF